MLNNFKADILSNVLAHACVDTHGFFRTFSCPRIVVTAVPGRLIHISVMLLLWLFNDTISTLYVLYSSQIRLESNRVLFKVIPMKSLKKTTKNYAYLIH
jgi:hypothetical protein